MTIDAFLEDLASYEAPLTFNPWRDTDPAYEVAGAVDIRRRQLRDYLARRLGKARILLIAEACGYQGGHFSGIAMTCERMLLNLHPVVGSTMVLGREGQRTSLATSPFLKPVQQQKGFNEPTDSVVWSAALETGLPPDDFLLWNIYPFHPYKKGSLLTNRTPTEEELAAGLSYAERLLSLFGDLPIYAIGKKSETTLSDAGFSVKGLRHPANGGAGIFRAQLAEFLGQRKVHSV